MKPKMKRVNSMSDKDSNNSKKTFINQYDHIFDTEDGSLILSNEGREVLNKLILITEDEVLTENGLKRNILMNYIRGTTAVSRKGASSIIRFLNSSGYIDLSTVPTETLMKEISRRLDQK